MIRGNVMYLTIQQFKNHHFYSSISGIPNFCQSDW